MSSPWSAPRRFGSCAAVAAVLTLASAPAVNARAPSARLSFKLPKSTTLGEPVPSRSAGNRIADARPGPINRGGIMPGQSYWRERGGSIVLIWSTGFGGVELTVDANPDSHRGTARAFTDVVGVVRPTAPVRLRRTPCTG